MARRRFDSNARRRRRMAEMRSAFSSAPEQLGDVVPPETQDPRIGRRLRRRDVLVGVGAGVAVGGLLSGLNWFDATADGLNSAVPDEVVTISKLDDSPATPAAPTPQFAASTDPVVTEVLSAQTLAELEGHRTARLSHRLGDPAAPLLLVEYFSYTCPHCATFAALIEPQVIESFVDTGQVLLVARHRPFGSDAINASRISIAAAKQDPAAFWPAHAKLFPTILAMADNGYDWDDFKPLADELALDADLLIEDAQSDYASNLLQANIAEASKLAVEGTPTFFLNGERRVGSGSLNEFLDAINQALDAL